MRKFLFIIFAAACLCSCLGTKKTTETNEFTSFNKEVNTSNDSEKVTKINNAINDKTGISLKTADSLANARIKEALRGYNYTKQSGTNSTSVRFDEASMQLLLDNIIGETSDHKEVNKKTSETTVTFERQVEQYVKKVINQLPWWAYLIALFYFLPQLIQIIKIIYVPVSGIIGFITQKNGERKGFKN